MTTQYQLELLNPVSGEWVPHGTPSRSMTAAHLWGLRTYPTMDLRVVPVDVEDVVRHMVVDGQPVIVTPGVLETVVIDEITRRRESNAQIEKSAAIVSTTAHNSVLRSEFEKKEE